jgi:ABC-type multidrug transport system fused ATPase/permease subunit
LYLFLVIHNLLSHKSEQTSPLVVRDLSFHIKAGERVGVGERFIRLFPHILSFGSLVGRTGSGKSTLTLALLRAVLTEGNIYYDTLPINSLNLDALRSSITIIPQIVRFSDYDMALLMNANGQPELLSGTLRENLDLFEEYDDVTLNEALRSAGLFRLNSNSNQGVLNLDSQISGGGSNLSVGQRQIVALARAMVRQCKLLVLDEATSAIGEDGMLCTTLRGIYSSQIS